VSYGAQVVLQRLSLLSETPLEKNIEARGVHAEFSKAW
jgi:hypothetical protein